MTTEEKALALVNEVRALGHHEPTSLGVMSNHYSFYALCRAIEAHEADKKAFSDVAKEAVAMIENGESYNAADQISPFILPEPDPLVEARRQIADRVLRQFGAPASDEDCIGLIVAALEEQAKIERIDND